MLALLKSFAKGVLYIILLPFLIVAIVLFGAYGLFAFVIQIIMSVIFFFTGQKFFPELPEDKELRLLKEQASQPEFPIPDEQEDKDPVSYQEEVIKEEPPHVSPVFHQSVEEACFQEEKEEVALSNEEEDIESEIEEEESSEEEDNVLSNALRDLLTGSKEEEEIEEEQLEEYKPKTSSYSQEYDEDDTEDNNGVNINFDEWRK